jgi:hypothetical protein
MYYFPGEKNVLWCGKYGDQFINYAVCTLLKKREKGELSALNPV